MSTELYIPNIVGKPGTEFYEHSETFRRRSEASKAKMTKYWTESRRMSRVDHKQAKPVAVYTMQGNFIGWWPSARKTAIALFPGEDYHITERGVRACRQNKQGRWAKRSFRSYMFRDWTGDTSDIAPYQTPKKKNHRSGYRKDNSFLQKPCTVDYGDGDLISFDSLKECAAAIHGSYSGIWLAMKQERKFKGKIIRFKPIQL